MMAKIKLSYFDIPGGRGEDCRIAMFMAGIDFEDDRISFTDWPQRKAETPLGALPVMTVEGKGTLTQSNAILTYVGRLSGLHPTDDPWEVARHEALLGASEDLRVAMVPTFYMPDDERKSAREELAGTKVKAWAALTESEIAGPHVSGDTLHVVDLRVYAMVRWFIGGGMDFIPADVFSDFPKLLALDAKVGAHEKVVAWYAR